MRTGWHFYSAGDLYFGEGCVKHLGRQVTDWGWKRVMVVTDETLMRVGIGERIESILRKAGIGVELFSGGVPEPALEVALRAAEQARVFGPDAILGLGGGSNMDLAKMTAVLLTHGGDPKQYFGFNQVPGPIVPLIGVPTTAGTGSEVSHAAVLTDTDQGIKVSCLSRWLRPRLAVVDPELTWTCPPRPSADSGIDALTHAVEAYTNIDSTRLDIPDGESVAYDGKTLMGDLLAEKALEGVGKYLVRAVADGEDREARQGMSFAATLAGLAFSNAGVGIVHALEYPLGGVLHCTHGAGNGLLLPYVMRFNLEVRRKEIARIGQILGVVPSAGMSEEEAALETISGIEMLKKKIGIPLRLRDIGAREDQLPEFARRSFQISRLMKMNARPVQEADLLSILTAAF